MSEKRFAVVPSRTFNVGDAPVEASVRPAGPVQGSILPAGSDEAYMLTGKHDAVMVLPAPGGGKYLLTKEFVLSLFAEVERAVEPEP
jgi:hypothetical protein